MFGYTCSLPGLYFAAFKTKAIVLLTNPKFFWRYSAHLRCNIYHYFLTQQNLSEYRRSSGYDCLDLRCFMVTNTPHKNTKDDNIEAVKLDHCDQEL